MSRGVDCSEEVVFASDHREVVFGLALHWRRHCLEPCEGPWVVNALLEQVQFRLANTHLAVHFEEALTRVVEGIVADGLELQVFGVAAQKVQRFSL